MDSETHNLGSTTKGADTDCELRSSGATHETDSGIISVQFLEFKTSLLEAVEELHIHRDAEKRYEAQICKLVLEKQELEWQKDSLQSQVDKMTSEHSESLATLKKQFQDQFRGFEGEKGKHQLSAEMKDKEIMILREELKSLQLFKYSLEKKLSELEQKLQLHTQVKDRHLSQLGEVERRFGAVSKQCSMVKQAHQKLEHNVEEAMRLNKRYMSFIKKQESAIAALKKDVERLNSELVKCKVSSVCRSGEESSNWLLKEQQLQELEQRLAVETELNKKLRNENDVERVQRQELLSSLQQAQLLLQTETEALSRNEQQLLQQTEEYQILKREHEMIQKRRQDKEDALMQLIVEHKDSQITLEKELQMLRAKMQADQEELNAVREEYRHLYEKHHHLSACAMHQDTHVPNAENGMRINFNIQRQSPSSLKCHIHRDIAGNLSKDVSLDTEGNEVSPQNGFEQMRHCKETKNIPDERTVECLEAAKDGCFHRESSEVNVGSQTDGNVLQASLGPDLPAAGESGGAADMRTTDQRQDPAVRQEASVGESVPVYSTFDNGCPSNDMQSCTDSGLAKLSEPETRSVYGVASDPVMSEPGARPQSLCVSEMRELQTPDKHASETPQDTGLKEAEPKGTTSECNRPSVSPEDGKMTVERPAPTADSSADAVLKGNCAHGQNPVTHKLLDAAHVSPQQLSIPQQCNSHLRALSSAGLVPGMRCAERRDLHSQSLLNRGSSVQQQALENVNGHFGKTEANSVQDAESNTSATPPELFSHAFSLAETLIENGPDGSSTTAMSAQRVSEQNVDPSQDPQVSKPHGNSLPSARISKPGEQLNDSQEQITGIEPSYVDGSPMFRSSFKPSMNPKETVNTQLKSSQRAAGVSPRDSKNNSSASSAPLVSEQKSTLPSGFQEVVEPMCTPLFPTYKQINRELILPLNKSSVHPDSQSEWNAVKQTFSEVSAEKNSRVSVSSGSVQAGSPAARHGGSGLRERVQAGGRGSRPAYEQRMSTHLRKKDHRHNDLRAQIAKIKQFLTSEGEKLPKRCRRDECEVWKE